MTLAISPQERRQFRILARDGVRKLLNSAMLARDADPIQFALWTTALVATPPSFYGFGQAFKYAALRTAPPAVVEGIILHDRMFFIVYSLIAAALLAAMTWDALYPDRDEQDILGALPVRPRTATAARLCAALGVATAFAIAINLPSAVLFSFVSSVPPLTGYLPVAFFAHLVSTTAGCVSVFATLLILRGVISAVLGGAFADRITTGLQLVTIVALIEVFFYLPTVLPALVHLMSIGSATALWLPSTWFGAVYSGLAGPRHAVYPGEALVGLAVLTGALLVVVPLYLVPARVMARRALESRSLRGSRVWGGHVILRAAGVFTGTSAGASIARFSLLSLSRSRRHVLVVVSYMGVGAALAMVQVLASGLRGGVPVEMPGPALLAVPLILMFFLTTGMRVAFSAPRDLHANWVFRLHAPATSAAAAGTYAAIFVAAIAPVLLAASVGAQAAGWSGYATALVLTFDLLAGLLLLECGLYGWTVIPFACARADGQEAMQTRWLAAAGPFFLYTVGGAALQSAALESGFGALALCVVLAVAAGGLRRLRLRRIRREAIPFDGPTGHLEVLNLSEALH